jgi:hypothetical protein
MFRCIDYSIFSGRIRSRNRADLSRSGLISDWFQNMNQVHARHIWVCLHKCAFVPLCMTMGRQ